MSSALRRVSASRSIAGRAALAALLTCVPGSRVRPATAFWQVRGPYEAEPGPKAVGLSGHPAERIPVPLLAVEGTAGSAIVVAECVPGDRRPALYRVFAQGGSPEPVGDPGGQIGPINAVAAAAGGVVAGGSCGLWQITGGTVSALDLFVGVHTGSFVSPGPVRVREACVGLAVDGGGNLWVAGLNRASLGFGGFSGFLVFATERAAWLTEYAGEPLDAPCPLMLRWHAAYQAMTGDPRGARAWVYGTRESGEADLVGVEYGMASQTGGVDPPAAVLGGAGAPTVARPELAAGTDGRVWLAGDTLGGSRVYVFDGKAFSDVTPADDLLKGRRFTQLLMSKTGDLYAATDGVGVLVYDGKAWREHPVNADLPTLEGTEIKPVSCIDLDPNLGYLWVGMDNNVICWRPDQQR